LWNRQAMFIHSTIIVTIHLTNSHLPYADDIIGVASKQSLTISRPGHRQALWGISLAVLGAGRNDFILQLIDLSLSFEIPDLDGGAGSSAQPVTVGGEAQGIDNIIVVQSVQTLVIIQVPKHGFAVLATRCAQRTIRRDGDCVQITRVVIVVLLQTAVSQVPDLDHVVPTARNNYGVVVVGGESYT